VVVAAALGAAAVIASGAAAVVEGRVAAAAVATVGANLAGRQVFLNGRG